MKFDIRVEAGRVIYLREDEPGAKGSLVVLSVASGNQNRSAT
ncbi:MAG: hypothetical protein AB1374_01620 [Bacillota bacterium]